MGGLSVWNNMQYEEGVCFVHSMPDDFTTTDEFASRVRGTYTVVRHFNPTPLRPEGTVTQNCKVSVDCEKKDDRDDSRCITFKSWKWEQQIPCFYSEDDFYGTKGKELFCNGLPSDLQTELFTVVCAGIVLLFACGGYGLLWWRRYDMIRQQILGQ